MVMKTKIIGTRVSVVLYQQLEKCAGDNRTLGDVVKEALERYCFPSVSKPVVDRSNTDNLKPSLDNPVRQKPSGRSDDFFV